MIGTILNKLCDLGDFYHDNDMPEHRKVVHKCQDIVHEVYKTTEELKVKKDFKPGTDAYEKFVQTIPGVTIFYDPDDRTYIYDYEGWHFDSALEVLKYCVEKSEKKRQHLQSQYKKEFMLGLRQIVDKLDDVLKRNPPEGAVEVEISEKVKMPFN